MLLLVYKTYVLGRDKGHNFLCKSPSERFFSGGEESCKIFHLGALPHAPWRNVPGIAPPIHSPEAPYSYCSALKNPSVILLSRFPIRFPLPPTVQKSFPYCSEVLILMIRSQFLEVKRQRHACWMIGTASSFILRGVIASWISISFCNFDLIPAVALS